MLLAVKGSVCAAVGAAVFVDTAVTKADTDNDGMSLAEGGSVCAPVGSAVFVGTIVNVAATVDVIVVYVVGVNNDDAVRTSVVLATRLSVCIIEVSGILVIDP